MSAVDEIGKSACHNFKVVREPSFLIAPAIVLWTPKNTSNIGGALRAAACFGIKQVWTIGLRPRLNPRHVYYKHPSMTRNIKEPVELVLADEDFLYLVDNKIGVEIVDRTIPLSVFKHPNDGIYIFGPEDGSIPKRVLEECKNVVEITSNFCLNLSAAINIVLYDRSTKVVL